MEGSASFPMYDDLQGGLLLLFSNKFEIADEFFVMIKNNNPRAGLHYGESAVIRSVLTERQEDRTEAMERLNQTIKLGEEHIKVLEGGGIPKGRSDITKDNSFDFLIDTKAALADAHTMLAGLLILEDSRVKGLWNLRKGWKIYKSTLSLANGKDKANPPRVNPLVMSSLKFGAGLFHFIISLIPPGLPEKVASLAGFKKGDNFKEIGLDYLREVHHSKSIRSDLAGIVLAVHHMLLTADLDPATTKKLLAEAEEIYRGGMEKYPEGSVFQCLACLAALEVGSVDTDNALKYVDQAIDNCKNVTTDPALLLRFKSQVYVMQFDWKTLSQLLLDIQAKIVESNKSKKSKSGNAWVYVYNSLRLGACFMMLGDTDKAKKYFKETASAKTTEQWSEQLTFQAKRFISNGGYFAMFELMVLTEAFEKIVRNASEDRLNEILAIVEDLAKKAPGALNPVKKEMKISSKGKENDPNLDNRLAYMVLKASVLRCMNRKDEARACAMEVLDANSYGFLKDKMFYALALMEVGKLSASKEEATKHYETAMKLSTFPWEQTVKRRIRECMQILGIEVIPVAETDKDEEQKMLAEMNEIIEDEKADKDED